MRERGEARSLRIQVMADLSRRSVIAGTATIGGLAMAGGDGDSYAGQPPYGPMTSPLQGKELPSLRYALGAAPNIPHDGGWSKEATVRNFPVSEKLAGVLMQLEPGGLRWDIRVEPAVPLDGLRSVQVLRRKVNPVRLTAEEER